MSKRKAKPLVKNFWKEQARNLVPVTGSVAVHWQEGNLWPVRCVQLDGEALEVQDMLEADLEVLEGIEALPVMGADGTELAPLFLGLGEFVTAEDIADGVRRESDVVLVLQVMCQPDTPDVGLLALPDHQPLYFSRSLPGTVPGTTRPILETQVISVTTDPLPDCIARAGEVSGSLGDITGQVVVGLQEHAAGQSLIDSSEFSVGERDHGTTSVTNW